MTDWLRHAASCLALLSLPMTAQAAGAPPTGVYGCYDVKMDGRMRLVVTPMPFVMFGLVDGSTYSDWDGNHGHYSYDPGTGTITMTDGSRQGWRYARTADWSFTLIDNWTGNRTYTCPFDGTKDPGGGPW